MQKVNKRDSRIVGATLSTVFLAIMLSACNSLNPAYDGSYVSAEGYTLNISKDSVTLGGLQQLGLSDQTASGGSHGFGSVMKDISKGHTGIFSLLAATSIAGVPTDDPLFAPRESERMEKMAGMTLSDTESDVYVVTENGIKSQDAGLHRFATLMEGPANVIAFRAKNALDAKVNELDVQFAPEVDLATTHIALTPLSDTIVFNAKSVIKMHFVRKK